MKFTVSSADLLKKLQLAGGAIGSNAVIPILEDFHFSINDNLLRIAATDLETTITTSLEVSSDKDGDIAIPARILVDTLKALPEQPITLDVNEDNHSIEITSAYGRYSMAGNNPDDFPSLPSPESIERVELSEKIISNAIAKTLFATSNDDLRLAMTGVYVLVDFHKLVFVSTDAHKLVRYTFENVQSDVTTSFIIPKKSMMLLKNILSDSKNIALSFNKSNAFFSFDDAQLACRLIDAKYPDYNAVIPKENPNLLTLSRSDLLNSLRRIAIYANKTTNQVKLSLSESSLTISAQDLDFSNEATEQIGCEYSGDPMVIGFNAKFLIEMLSVLDTEKVNLHLSSPNRAGILKPDSDQDSTGEEVLMLVMPVMINA